MAQREELIENITKLVLENWTRLTDEPYQVPTGISARHIHLSRTDLDMLFGPGYRLTPMKALSQPGQFACEEQVTVAGPKGNISKVRILGPERHQSQVELSFSDCRTLGISAPVRTSGHLDHTPGITIQGPKGMITLSQGVIIADRHIHMTPADAKWFGVKDQERVNVIIDGPKGGILSQVVIRISNNAQLDFHVDTDDANAFQLKQGQWVTIRKGEAG